MLDTIINRHVCGNCQRVLSIVLRFYEVKESEKCIHIILTNLFQLYILFIYRDKGSDRLNIFIDNKSGAPIYDQIYSQIKAQIINGTLNEDDPLPSSRSLAKDLRIRVITTKRAYDELEKEGFIYTIAGKGCFVAPKNVELLREENLKKIEAYMQEITRLAASCGLSREDIIEMFNIIGED